MSTSIDTDLGGHAAQPAASAERTRVWDLPTRIFHWTFAGSFALAWLTSESERWMNLHLMLGYTFAAMLLFRLLWGVVGSRYARFSSFLFSPSALFAYLRSLVAGRPEHHLGHNPAGAVAIFLMLGLGAVVAITGLATYQDVGGEWLEELHEGAASAMLAVVVIHIAGVVVSSLMHRENLARAMVTGWKRGAPAEGIGAPHWLAGIVLLLAVLGTWGAWQAGLTGGLLPDATLSADAGGHGEQDHDDDD